ncbi:MAG: hypothetical protein ACPL0F_07965, partial [bacterium]
MALITLTLLLPIFLPEEHPLIHLAQRLTQIGNYEAALTEYKRFICFSKDSMAIVQGWRQIAKL